MPLSERGRLVGVSVAVLLIVVLRKIPGFTRAVTRNVAVDRPGMLSIVSRQVVARVGQRERRARRSAPGSTKNSCDGSRSDSTTCVAGEPPAFWTVIVYWTLSPAKARTGPAFLTLRAGGLNTVVVTEALLLAKFGSAVADVTVAVSVTAVLFAAVAWNLALNVAVAPAGSVPPTGGPDVWVKTRVPNPAGVGSLTR